MPKSCESWSRQQQSVTGWRRGSRFSGLLLAVIFVCARQAHAEPGLIEAGVKLGPSWETQSGDRELAENVYKLGGAAGVALRYGLFDLLAVQLEVLYATRGTDVAVQGIAFGGFHFAYVEVPLLARLQWRVPILAGDGHSPPLSGYLLAGPALSYLLGGERVDDSGSQKLPRGDLNSLDVSLIAGLGLVGNITARLAVSFEARYEMGLVDVFSNSMTGAESKNRAILLMFGMDYKFNDSDGDRMVDGRDRCPAQSEDWNDYKDSDGCPDADEDEDGIAIGTDRCPERAENVNGYDDTDGCPEADEDDDGIVGDADKCPTEVEDRNGYRDLDGCPDADEDKDGIIVDADKCPEQAEDFDEHADTDGCPDPDNDGDGLADADDQCPNEAFPRMGGCLPKFVEARVEGDRIVLQHPLEFSRRNAALNREQKRDLDRVVELMKSYYPQMQLRLEGHADGEGKGDRNQILSQERADTVADYLEGKGINSERLAAKGFGEDKPIRREENERGKQKNRRVELVIINPNER